MPAEPLPQGAYDRLLTAELASRLAGLRVATGAVEEAESADALGLHVGRAVARHLAGLPAEQRVDAANRVLAAFGEQDVVRAGPENLLAVARQEAPGVWEVLQTRPQVPAVPTRAADELAADPKLGSELRAELATADGVDLLCAFVKWYGLRVLESRAGRTRTAGGCRCAS